MLTLRLARTARGYNLRVRGVVVTCAFACFVAACATTAGWAVQAAALPPPTRADRVAGSAVTWFLRYRLFEARIRLRTGQLVRSECLAGWLPVLPHRGLDRATVLALSDGSAMVAARPHLEKTRRRRPQRP